MSTKRSENACPHGEFIRAFATELGVSQAVAKHIYTVFYVTILKQLKTYDAVNITPFLGQLGFIAIYSSKFITKISFKQQ